MKHFRVICKARLRTHKSDKPAGKTLRAMYGELCKDWAEISNLITFKVAHYLESPPCQHETISSNILPHRPLLLNR